MRIIFIMLFVTYCISEQKTIFRPNPDLFEGWLLKLFPDKLESNRFNCEPNGTGIPITFLYPESKNYGPFISAKKYYTCTSKDGKSIVYEYSVDISEDLQDFDGVKRLHHCLFSVRKELKGTENNFLKRKVLNDESMLEAWYEEHLIKNRLCSDPAERILSDTLARNNKLEEFEKIQKSHYTSEQYYGYGQYRKFFCGTFSLEKPKEGDPLLRKLEKGNNGDYIHWTEYLCKGDYWY